MTDLLNFRPMIPMGAILLKEGMDEIIDNPDYIGEIKYDGYRMLGWLGEGVRYTTRSVGIDSIRAGNPTPTERTLNVHHLSNLKHDLFGTILDGEFWKEGCRSHDITSMIGGLPETSIVNQEREGFVSYIIYDIVQYKGTMVDHLPFKSRRKLLEEEIMPHLLEHNPDNGFFQLSQQVQHEDKRQVYEDVVRSGGEGLILKHIDSLYYIGKIDKNGKGVPSKIKASTRNKLQYSPWVKWKKYSTYDCVIMGFKPASEIYKGNELGDWQYWKDEEGLKLRLNGVDKAVEYTHQLGLKINPITKFHFYNWPGSILFGQYNKEGKLIEVGHTSGISDEMRKKFAENPNEYIGRVAEVGSMERIKKTNALREPRFLGLRPEWDKPAHECTID